MFLPFQPYLFFHIHDYLNVSCMTDILVFFVNVFEIFKSQILSKCRCGFLILFGINCMIKQNRFSVVYKLLPVNLTWLHQVYEKKSGILYRYKCDRLECDEEYTGKSARTFGEV